MSASTDRSTPALLRNPLLWALVGLAVLALVGAMSVATAVRYDGPPDTTCGIEYSGSQGRVSCSDSAAGEAAAAALFGVVEPGTTIRSQALLWVARVAFVPVAAVLLWALGALAVGLVVGSPGSPRRELRRARRRQARRRAGG